MLVLFVGLRGRRVRITPLPIFFDLFATSDVQGKERK